MVVLGKHAVLALPGCTAHRAKLQQVLDCGPRFLQFSCMCQCAPEMPVRSRDERRRMATIFLRCSTKPRHGFRHLPTVDMTVGPRPREGKNLIVERAQTQGAIGMFSGGNVVAGKIMGVAGDIRSNDCGQFALLSRQRHPPG